MKKTNGYSYFWKLKNETQLEIVMEMGILIKNKIENGGRYESSSNVSVKLWIICFIS